MEENEKVTQEEIIEEVPEKSETELLEEQITALNDKLLRTAAEFDNYKKRTLRERDDFYKMSVTTPCLGKPGPSMT